MSTYYEFMDILDKLKKCSRNQELYNKLMNINLELYNDMYFRVGIQILNFINEKITIVYKNIINKMYSNYYNIDDFNLLINELKNDMDYINSYLSFKYLNNEFKEEIINVRDSLISSYNKTIDIIVSNVYDDNYKNIFNDIMNNKGE